MLSMRDRTVLQRVANDFDRRLYDLIHEAENLNAHNFRSDDAVGQEWKRIAAALVAIRPAVRAMMRDKDQAETQ